MRLFPIFCCFFVLIFLTAGAWAQSEPKLGEPDPTCYSGPFVTEYVYDRNGRAGMNVTGGFLDTRQTTYLPGGATECSDEGQLFGYRIDPPLAYPDAFKPFFGYARCCSICPGRGSDCQIVLIPVDGQAVGMGGLYTVPAPGYPNLSLVRLQSFLADSITSASRVQAVSFNSERNEASASIYYHGQYPSDSAAFASGDLFGSNGACCGQPWLFIGESSDTYTGTISSQRFFKRRLPVAMLEIGFSFSTSDPTSLTLPLANNTLVEANLPLSSRGQLLASTEDPLPPLSLPTHAYILRPAIELILSGEGVVTPDLLPQIDLDHDGLITPRDLLIAEGGATDTPSPSPSPIPTPTPTPVPTVTVPPPTSTPILPTATPSPAQREGWVFAGLSEEVTP